MGYGGENCYVMEGDMLRDGWLVWGVSSWMGCVIYKF